MRPPRLFRTTAFRLTALFAAIFLACVLLLYATVAWYAFGTLNAELRQTIAARLSAILEDNPRAGPGLAEALADAAEQTPGTYALLLDAQGRRLAGNLPAGSAPLAARPTGWFRLGVASGLAGPAHPVLARAERLPDGAYLLLGQDEFALATLRVLIGRAFAIGGTLTLLLALIAGFLASRSILRRLAAIGAAGERIMRGDLSGRLPTRGTGDELDQLVAAFNAMLDRIAALMETMRQVTNDIAHDLRTPLTRLAARLESARRRPRAGPEYERAIDRAIADARGVLDTFAALLRIAEIEAAPGAIATATVDAAHLAAMVAELYEPLAEARGQHIAICAASIALRGERELLTQMLGNLVENACRHAPPGSHVEIGAAARDGGALLWVEDDGPGIPQAERERVFRRFYRLDASRRTPGSGLGLPLVAAIAARHGGTVRLLDARPGLRAEVWLPAADLLYRGVPPA